MKKVITNLILSCMSLLLFVGCTNNSPAKVVESYFEDVKNNEDKYILEHSNRVIEIVSQFKKDIPEFQSSNEIQSAMANFYSKFDAVIIEEIINDNKSIVKVELTAPSMTTALNAYLEEGLYPSFKDGILKVNEKNITMEEAESALIDKINTATPEIRIINVTVDKIKNKWVLLTDSKLFLDILGLPSFGL